MGRRRDPDCEPWPDEWDDPLRKHRPTLAEEIRDTDWSHRRQYDQFRLAADYVAVAFSRLPIVEKVALFGSVARPLVKEVPRHDRLRRARAEVWHECRNVNLAVWVNDLSGLRALGKARGQALNVLLDQTGAGVAHHQVDVAVYEPQTDRYRGALCIFGQCPKGKRECRVPGCGAAPFLQLFEGFRMDPAALDGALTLFDRAAGVGPPVLRPVVFEPFPYLDAQESAEGDDEEDDNPF